MAVRLRCNKATELVSFNKSRQCFVGCTSNSVYRGVCPFLKSSFYPLYTYMAASSRATSPTTSPVSPQTAMGGGSDNKYEPHEPYVHQPIYTGHIKSSEESVTPPNPRSLEEGIKLGVRIDNELRRFVDSSLESLGVGSVVSPTMISKYLQSTSKTKKPNNKKKEKKDKRKQKKTKKNKRNSIHPRTRNILRYIASKQWSIVGCQVPVACKNTRIATSIDIVCMDTSTQCFILVECKSGFDSYYEVGSGHHMQHPFHTWDDSPFHQHQLQVVSGKVLFVYTYDIPVTRTRTCVLRSGRKGVQSYAELDGVYSRLSMILIK
jgi:hypothetical protein